MMGLLVQYRNAAESVLPDGVYCSVNNCIISSIFTGGTPFFSPALKVTESSSFAIA
jgi:hypothetical protein